MSENPMPLLNFIGAIECGDAWKRQGHASIYDTVVWAAHRILPPQQPLTLMTVGDVIVWQRRTVGAQAAAGLRKDQRSSAAGKFQIIGPTLKQMVAQGVVDAEDTFDANAQDRLALHLLRGRGWDDWARGDMTDGAFVDGLAREWASIPAMTGRGAYDGVGSNKALTGPGRVLAVLQECRVANAREASASKFEPPDVEPPDVEPPDLVPPDVEPPDLVPPLPKRTGFGAFLSRIFGG